MQMSERSIRDIVISIEKSVKMPTQVKVGKPTKREKQPIPLTGEQRDIIEIVYDDISKPFGITDFTAQCIDLGMLESVVFNQNGDTNRSLKGWLCEKMGMKVVWRQAHR